ncbi:MAG: hypothetical protein RL172_377 [Bacteroidota bacterium]|jgi:tetratricopeptide (TPR) repeat protein
MKYLVTIFTLALFACNNTDTASPAGNASAMPAEEKRLREQIALYPDSLAITEQLIEYFRSNGNYSQAIAETEKVLAANSQNEKFLYMKAMLLSNTADTAKAIASWEQLIALVPRPEHLMSAGSLYAFAGNAKALSIADSLMAPGLNTAYQANFIKGLYYSSTAQKTKAIPFFDTCIQLDYGNTLSYREKAIALYDLGKYEEAVKTLQTALTIKSTYEEAYYWLGRCYEKLNNKKEAINQYKNALQFSGDYPEAKDALEKLGVVL